jgi:hypothetical protein
MSIPNLDTTDGHKHNSARVPYLEYYYPKYSHDPRFQWKEQILVEEGKRSPRDRGGSNRGWAKSVQETG